MRTLILVLILLFAFGCRPHNNDKTPEKEKDRILDSLQRISPDLAISFIDDRLQNIPEDVFDELVYDLYSRKAQILESKGDHDPAIEIYHHLLRLAAGADKFELVIPVYLNLGQYYLDRGRYNVALTYFGRIAERDDVDLRYLLSAHTGLGSTSLDLGDFNNAIKHYLKALDISRNINDSHSEATLLFNLALAYAEAGMLHESNKYIDNAIEKFFILNDSLLIAKCYSNKAINYKNAANDSAAYYYDKALDIFLMKNDSMSYIIGVYNKALELMRQQLPGVPEKLNTVLDYSKRHDILQGKIMANNALSDYYGRTNRSAIGLDHAHLAVTLAEESKNIRLQYQTRVTLAERYRELDDLKNLSECLLSVIELRDQMNKDENKKAAVELQQLFQAAELERDNLLITKQFQDQKAHNRRIIHNLYVLAGISSILILLLIILYRLYSSREKAYLALMRIYRDQVITGTQTEPNQLTANHAGDNGKNIDYEFIKRKAAFVMEEEKPFLDSHLTINRFVEQVGISRKDFSSYLQHNNKNFCQYVNEYRIGYAQKLLAANPGAPLKIEYLAAVSGFNSRQVFYRVFTTIAGVPPGLYREQIRQGE